MSSVLTIIVAVGLVVVVIFAATVTHHQDTKPDSLPGCLRTWDCLPSFMRSLEPYDRVCCAVCNKAIAKKTAAAEAELAAKKPAPAKDDLKIATQRLGLDDSLVPDAKP